MVAREAPRLRSENLKIIRNVHTFLSTPTGTRGTSGMMG